MKGPDYVRQFEGYWPTNKGAWFPGETVRYRQKSLFDDFSDRSWMTLLMYGIKGEMPTKAQARVLEIIWTICTSYPDPRIWNNRVAALAGTARSTGPLAVGAATAVSEASIYGRKADLRSSEFLYQAIENRDTAEQLEAFVLSYVKQYRGVPGFGRPVISRDERIEPLLKQVQHLLGPDLPFVTLIGEVEQILEKRRYRLKANVSAYCAAILAEIGYSPREFVFIALLSFSAGLLPCYIDTLEKPEGVFFPMQVEQIEYRGCKKRELK